jgi:hypothetical protein
MDEHPEAVWTIAVQMDDDAFLDVLLVLGDRGLVDICEECSEQTTGVVFHNVPGVEKEEIDEALFAVAGG